MISEGERFRTITGAYGALKLDPEHPGHHHLAAEIIANGGIIAAGFNGPFGIFANAHNPQAYQKIYEAKDRPVDKKLILVTTPNNIPNFADVSSLHPSYPWTRVENIWSNIHALGVILPASLHAPPELVGQTDEGLATVLPIWTESALLRRLLDDLSGYGIHGLVGTSANKSGQPTISDYRKLVCDFNYDVEAIFYDDFSDLPPARRISTSIVDLTGERPFLNRLGNASVTEISTALRSCDLPSFISVNQRTKFLPKP